MQPGHEIRVHLHEQLLESVPFLATGKMQLNQILQASRLLRSDNPLFAHPFNLFTQSIKHIVLILHGKHHGKKLPPALLHCKPAVANGKLMPFLLAVKHEIDDPTQQKQSKQSCNKIQPYALNPFIFPSHGQRDLTHIDQPKDL